MRETTRLSAWQIWRWPLWLALLSGIGLIAALLSDNAGDFIAWLTLSIPLLVIAFYWLKKPASNG